MTKLWWMYVTAFLAGIGITIMGMLQGDAALVGAGIGGISGMVIGMIVGAVSSGEVWTTVPLPTIRTHKQN